MPLEYYCKTCDWKGNLREIPFVLSLAAMHCLSFGKALQKERKVFIPVCPKCRHTEIVSEALRDKEFALIIEVPFVYGAKKDTLGMGIE